MSEQKRDPGFVELTHRVGGGTEFAATLTCLPFEDDNGWSWRGMIRFDNNIFNLMDRFPKYDGGDFDMPRDWVYPQDKSGGAHLMGLLEGWWQDFCGLFARVRAADQSYIETQRAIRVCLTEIDQRTPEEETPRLMFVRNMLLARVNKGE